MRLQLIGLVLLATVFAAPVSAGTITVNFTSADQYGSAGSLLTFGGTLTNTGSPVYINGAGMSLSLFDPSNYDLTDFILNAPVDPLTDGQTTGPFDFFTVSIPLGFADGDYDGTFTVQGGATVDDDAFLGSGSFTVDVGPSDSVPEPGSWLLLGSALLAGGMARRHRGTRM